MSEKMFQIVRVAKIIPNGEAIRKHRLKSKLGLKDVAKKCNVSIGYLSRMEKGNVDYVSRKVAKKITICLSERIKVNK